ncbi:bifunctional diaminohydroxyphosphoribosylaminopyrimidine deaminase/5-amino-6-(5-phosphoribosylamino)uracil reductase RibD [Candidatus Erwinia haradaeae]|uniref:Riboflavin biosynthesis protein RibD n=1 Tax=Candidatus Erwinia haradaeae TaxID=1922217 RepID=A0A451D7L8_9GAMM|nr:bifunctional diaminohydroxyphosphoribosylaminopyrimidine deaminase/5-amino-6-(5-phosphoribosylamino)uracil reductase RibD [Candidatus Erwinia haradaeae]VFP81849.1 Riboflavin biosynthesis protein RibD [Candidatus Erwinia haradaeae]
MSDKVYMARALELAYRGRFTTAPNPNVGCVLVRNDSIVGEGYHQYRGGLHAEAHALLMAGEKARGATAYVTLEPCTYYGCTPPCCDALILSGIIRVVFSMKDPNPRVSGRGMYRLQQAGLNVSEGLMALEAEKINRGFLKRMRQGLPWIQLKLGASLDGKTAIANGESQWITSKESRSDVQNLRAQSSAILTTSTTVIMDNPELTVRYKDLDSSTSELYPVQRFRQPIRVVIDNNNRITPQHRIIDQPGETWLVRTKYNQLDWPNNVKRLDVKYYKNCLNLYSMFLELGSKQINVILVESGAKFAGALLNAQLVDELIVYLAPRLIGDTGRSLCEIPQLKRLKDALAFNFNDICRIGPDIKLILTPHIVIPKIKSIGE